MAEGLFPDRPLWRDIDKVKGTPHMNWGTCICSQCSIWRIVARIEELQDAIDDVRFALKDQHFGSFASLYRGVWEAVEGKGRE